MTLSDNQRLIQLRHTHPIIVYGRFRPLLEDSEEIYAYERVMDGQILTVAANWTDHEAACQLVEAAKGEMLITNYAEHKPGVLQPYEVQVFLYGDKDCRNPHKRMMPLF